jgi:hypothetical protein
MAWPAPRWASAESGPSGSATRWSLLLAFDLVVLGVLLAVTADRLLVGAAGTAAIAIALEVTRWLKR